MAVDFKSLLSKPSDSIEKPKLLPEGTYTGMIAKYEYAESKEKKTPYVRFLVRLTGFGEDIDPTDQVGIDLSKRELRKDFYITEDALHRLKTFWETCGIDGRGRTLSEIIPDLIQAEVMVTVGHRPSEDGKEVYVDLKDIKGMHELAA
jgi:hypothetical protein